jgi:hypothetical protein
MNSGKTKKWIERRQAVQARGAARDWGATQGLKGKANPLMFNNRQQYDDIARFLRAQSAAPAVQGAADAAGPLGEGYGNERYQRGQMIEHGWDSGIDPFSRANPLNWRNQQQKANIIAWLKAAEAADSNTGPIGAAGPRGDYVFHGPDQYDVSLNGWRQLGNDIGRAWHGLHLPTSF